MRLTEKRVIHPSCKVNGELENREYIYIKDKNLAEKKLFELEDIEEELGIELLTLFKALKNGIRIEKPLVMYHYVRFDSIEQDSCGDYLFNLVEGNYYLKDYGNTWTLKE